MMSCGDGIDCCVGSVGFIWACRPACDGKATVIFEV